ncbi:hypothetical protein V2J09_022933 [Rumex salicifolius]
MFVWLAARGGALCNSERRRRHLSNSATCACCNSDEETLDHLFRDYQLKSADLIFFPDPNFFSLHFASWLCSNILFNVDLADNWRWKDLFAMILWWMWKWRNKMAFKGNIWKGDGRKFVHEAIVAYRESTMNTLGFKGPFDKELALIS